MSPNAVPHRRWLAVWLVVGLAAALSTIATPPSAGAQTFDDRAQQCRTDGRAQCVHLRVFYINDLHGALEPGATTGGAAYLAAHIDRLSEGIQHTLFLGGGDLIGAAPPISGLLREEPTLAVTAAMGMDVSAVGNHEFDAGWPELQRLMDGGFNDVTGKRWPGMKFPFLGANVLDAETGEPVFDSTREFRIQGVPVTVVGVGYAATPGITVAGATDGLEFIDEAEGANRAIEPIVDAGKPAIIVAAHVGGTTWTDELDDEVDLVLGGHSHSRTNTLRDGLPIVQAGSAGTTLGVIDLILDKRTHDVSDVRAELVPVTHDVVPDRRIERMVDGYAEQVGPIVNRVVNVASETINRTRTQAGESPLGNLIADAQRAAAGTDFAFMNAGGIRANVAAGDVTWGDLYTVQPFGNTLVTMTMTGDQVVRLLEQQWEGGAAMLQFSGLEYTWQASAPVGSRVQSVTLADGGELDLDASYSVVANEFLAGAGDGYRVFAEPTDKVLLGDDLEALVTFVESLPNPFSYAVDGRVVRLP